MQHSKRLFVVDTNVFMHDPMAIFHFAEHDIFIPMVVLEELDAHKVGISEVARNVRQMNRLLDSFIVSLPHEAIEKGIPIQTTEQHKNTSFEGHLFLQTHEYDYKLPKGLLGDMPDNRLLATALALSQERAPQPVTLVTKDINLRIKARALGLQAEDYRRDQVLTDVNLLPKGLTKLPENFWEDEFNILESWQAKTKTYYRIENPSVSAWQINQGVYKPGADPIQALVREKNDNVALLETIDDFTNPKNNVWGLTARNLEQNFALNMLLHPDIDFVTLQGTAGSGKTLLALAAGLAQTLDNQRFQELIMTRITVPIGEDIGFLPGTEEEKMTPWMGALLDNLEVLHCSEHQSEWSKEATHDLLKRRIKIRSLNFMRGRTFFNRFIIIDEAQNLTPKQMKTLITRAGPGTKMICLGDIAQIDTPYIAANTSGLTYAIDGFKGWPHSGHIELVHGERSRLAKYAADSL